MPKSEPPEQIAKYASEPWEYEEELIALGERAVDPLIEAMFKDRYGYAAADALGSLGLPLPRVIEALKRGVAVGGGVTESSCRSLMKLGEVEYLFELVKAGKVRSAAVAALLKPLKSYDGAPLDYRIAERLWELGDDEVQQLVTEALAPGTQECDVTPEDIEEALRGATSASPIIRARAVRMLGSRPFRKVLKPALEMLAQALADESPDVRKWALLTLHDWKSKAKPYHSAMQALKDDSDPEVRQTARQMFPNDD